MEDNNIINHFPVGIPKDFEPFACEKDEISQKLLTFKCS